LGDLNRSQGRTDDAYQDYVDALNDFRQLAQQKPDVYLPSVAGTLNMLGILDASRNRIGESREHYQEALSLFRKLSQSAPGKYAGDVARVEASLEQLDRKSQSR
jgi:tetratricopeptide (TPR) repeat protein